MISEQKQASSSAEQDILKIAGAQTTLNLIGFHFIDELNK